MQTRQISPEDMEGRIVRFKSMRPRSREAQAASGIPTEVSEFMAADRNFTYMAPLLQNDSPITRFAAMRGGDAGDALSLSLAICAPGGGPQLHAHMQTEESFFCLKGRFEIRWGDRGEHQTHLDAYDFISVPKGVVRTFRNVGVDEAHLLVIIQGDKSAFNDVHHTPEVGQAIVERFGPEMKARLETTGRRFTAGT